MRIIEICAYILVFAMAMLYRQLWKETCQRWRKTLDELERIRAEKHFLQQLWVTVNLSCNPPDECNDPKILKKYMRACKKKADEYEAFIDNREI